MHTILLLLLLLLLLLVQAMHTDLNCQACIEYAVSALKVRVCEKMEGLRQEAQGFRACSGVVANLQQLLPLRALSGVGSRAGAPRLWWQ